MNKGIHQGGEITSELRMLMQTVEVLRRERNRAPFVGELQGRLSDSERTTRFRLHRLDEAGFINVEGTFKARAISLTEKGRAALGLQPEMQVFGIRNKRLESPIPVNPANCGSVVNTAAEPAYFVEYLADIFDDYQIGDQLLRAQGDSMVCPDKCCDSIFEGDRCLLRPSKWPEDGDAVYVEFEAFPGYRDQTLKEWHQNNESGLVTLKARNPAYPEIVRPVEEVIPCGVVMEIVRSMKRK
ncbi:MAG TPA: S24 family peptidase [Abditibacteriaceae bacterium]|jgi:SOS-response transcriptional repressor LexA